MTAPAFEIAHRNWDSRQVVAAPPVEPGVASVRIQIARPGDPIRIVNVLDAVQPSAKADKPEETFPGALGPAGLAGIGRTDVVDDVAILATCDFGATHDLGLLPNRPDGPSIVDMAGPGARYSPWGATTNIVVSFAIDSHSSLEEVDRGIRRATLAVARDVVALTTSQPPVRLETFARPSPAGESLPIVVPIVHVGAEGPLLDTFLYGESMLVTRPQILTAAELLDGALTSGHYDWAALRNPTYLYQNGRLLRRLLEARGATLEFEYVVVARTYLPTIGEKQALADESAQLASAVGAKGAVICTFQSGSSQTDAMLTINACEERDIKTVGIFSETDDGLTDFVASADCLVSTGNESDLVAAWEPEQVIGGEDHLRSPPSVLAYLGALSQLGDGQIRAMTA